MLVNTDYSKIGSLIQEILDIVKPIPESVSDKEKEELDEWRQRYVMSSHFNQWESEALEKFRDKIKGQKERGEEIKYLSF